MPLTLQSIPPYTLMWLLALALYFTAKIATLALATPKLPQIPTPRKLAYLLLFTGMNPTAFLAQKPKAPPMPRAPRVTPYLFNILTGTLLLYTLPRLLPHHPLLQASLGMVGLILLLHFGLLQLLSLAWQTRGFNAPLLMNAPLRSASVTEFWSLRWNTAFHHLSHQFLFKPLTRRIGTGLAMLLTFFISGIIHDLVISLPARAGFGLPTAYFLLQAAAVSFEHTRFAKLFLRHRTAARAYTLAAVALPAPLLFHIPFITRVFLPFMTAIGALP